MKNILSFILSFLTLCLYAQPINYSIHPLPTEQKMPIGNVHDIYRDREGYMWYSTEEGLLRDNGYQVDIFCSDSHERPLASNFITEIAEDFNHQIWFGTAKGTYVLDKQDYSIHAISIEGIQNLECEALTVLSDGTIWIATAKALIHLNSQQQVIERISTSPRRRGPRYANAFIEDSQHTLWLLETAGGICRFNREKGKFFPCLWLDRVEPRRMIEDTKHECFWVATGEHGIIRFLPNAIGTGTQSIIQPETLPKPNETNNKGQIIDIILDSTKKILWATSMDGMHAYDISSDGNLSERNLSGLLPTGKNIVDGMAYDQWGNIWVAGFSPHTFILSSLDGDIRRDCMEEVQQLAGTSIIGDFVISDNNYLWLWDPRLGLELYNPSTKHLTLAMHQSDDVSMRGSGVIAPRHKGGFWMASNNQILRLWHEGTKICRKRALLLPNVQIFGLYDPDDGSIWAATSKGIIRVSIYGKNKIEQVTDSNDVAFRIAIDQEGNYYYHAGRKGLIFHNTKSHQSVRLLPEYENCTAMTLATNDTLWFGTDLGRVLCFHRKDNSPKEKKQLGNPSGARILDIKCDRKGHVWAVSSQSVKEWNPNNGVCRTLMASNPHIGMDYFRTMAIWGDSICVAGAGGFFITASSENIKKEKNTIRPTISSYTINGEKMYIGYGQKDIVFPSTTDLIEINLTTLNHLFAPHTQFAYRLCPKNTFGGWDKEVRWNELAQGNNVILFNSLDKGHYLLQIKATDGYGLWGEVEDAIFLYRQPAWWETWWAYTFYILCTFSILTIIIKRYGNHVREKRTAQMEERLTEMKFRFFTNISHELRTPLSLMMVPLENMLKKSNTLVPQDRNRVEGIYSHASELMEMINQLLDFRRLELGETQLHLQKGNLTLFITTAIETFQPLAIRKGIILTEEHNENEINIVFDHEKLHHIIWNLLSNAMKFTDKGGKIMVGLVKLEKSVRLSVTDTGCGISEEDIPHLFERYYQSSNNTIEGGTGIGLHLVSELVHMHGGKISVESQLGKGSTFTIELPIQANETVAIEKKTVNESNEDAEENNIHEKNTLLLVEDNLEFRRMMADELSEESYNIIEANNGMEALEQLKKENIDLVISDIMMPQMDGLELCRRIKTDIELSHLPIIFLTAKSGDENQLEGYKMGADYYIVKPFSIGILLNRIQHLIEQKHINQEKFQHKQENDFKKLTHSKLDEEFLQKAFDVIQNNIKESGYGVEQFSSDMCVSRMTLYRKIQNITGQTPSDFMITIRLKNAARMLRETSLPIAIISDKTGFSNPSYFTKCFQKMFGVLPKQYRNN